MLIYFVSVASILAAGVSTYFALKLKGERDQLKIKFDQASKYADETAKANIGLSSKVTSLNASLQTSEKRVAELTAVADSLAANAKPAVEQKQTLSAPSINAKKAGRGRPAKKAVA